MKEIEKNSESRSVASRLNNVLISFVYLGIILKPVHWILVPFTDTVNVHYTAFAEGKHGEKLDGDIYCRSLCLIDFLRFNRQYCS